MLPQQQGIKNILTNYFFESINKIYDRFSMKTQKNYLTGFKHSFTLKIKQTDSPILLSVDKNKCVGNLISFSII